MLIGVDSFNKRQKSTDSDLEGKVWKEICDLSYQWCLCVVDLNKHLQGLAGINIHMAKYNTLAILKLTFANHGGLARKYQIKA